MFTRPTVKLHTKKGYGMTYRKDMNDVTTRDFSREISLIDISRGFTSTSTFYDNPSMVMITCRAQRSANRQKNYKKSADHINSDKIKLYTKFIYRLKFVV